MKIAVFCSSSTRISPMFLSEARQVGEVLAEDGHEVIYGGCSAGCMGALADGVLNKKGRLIGVVPELDFMQGLVHPELSEHHVVSTLSARKQLMIDLADTFIVFPGGLGTLDEALDVLALKSVGSLDKQVIFYNFLDAWRPFLEALDILCEQGLIRQSVAQLARVVDKTADLRENCQNDF
jgi:uncharacterized protein (TIGR00730 family)